MKPEIRKSLTKVFAIVAAVLAGHYVGSFALDAAKTHLKDGVSSNMTEETKRVRSSLHAMSAIFAFAGNNATVKNDVFTAVLTGKDAEPSTKVDFDFSTGQVCSTVLAGEAKPKCDDYNFQTDFPDNADVIKDIACTAAKNQNDEKFIQHHCVLTPSA